MKSLIRWLSDFKSYHLPYCVAHNQTPIILFSTKVFNLPKPWCWVLLQHTASICLDWNRGHSECHLHQGCTSVFPRLSPTAWPYRPFHQMHTKNHLATQSHSSDTLCVQSGWFSDGNLSGSKPINDKRQSSCQNTFLCGHSTQMDCKMKKYLDNFVPASRHNDWIAGVWWKPYTGYPFSMPLVLFEQMQVKNTVLSRVKPCQSKLLMDQIILPSLLQIFLNFGAHEWL